MDNDKTLWTSPRISFGCQKACAFTPAEGVPDSKHHALIKNHRSRILMSRAEVLKREIKPRAITQCYVAQALPRKGAQDCRDYSAGPPRDLRESMIHRAAQGENYQASQPRKQWSTQAA